MISSCSEGVAEDTGWASPCRRALGSLKCGLVLGLKLFIQVSSLLLALGPSLSLVSPPACSQQCCSPFHLLGKSCDYAGVGLTCNWDSWSPGRVMSPSPKSTMLSLTP